MPNQQHIPMHAYVFGVNDIKNEWMNEQQKLSTKNNIYEIKRNNNNKPTVKQVKKK